MNSFKVIAKSYVSEAIFYSSDNVTDVLEFLGESVLKFNAQSNEIHYQSEGRIRKAYPGVFFVRLGYGGVQKHSVDQFNEKFQPLVEDQSDHINAVYTERAQLVSALTKLFPASLEDHVLKEGEDWDPEWNTVVIIDLPTGQVSWHISSSDLRLFSHLQRNQGRVWDGHSTPEKYERLGALTQQV